MLRHLLPALLIGGLCAAVGAGCSAGASFDPEFGRSNDNDAQRTQLAAFAAQQQFPRDARASDDLRAAALINREKNTIRILNFSDRPLNDAVVWVNGAFVHRVSTVPPNGSVSIPRAQFYDSTGRSLSNQATSANRVQIQWGEELYNLQGPVYE
jgi:hypothetical protein